MSLPLPNLDDRDYARLVADTKAFIAARCPEWTDFSPGDPGLTLLEAFAYLTETMIFRLNRLPEKARIALLNLAGTTLLPPAAARTELVFSRVTPGPEPVTIPQGTRVTTPRAGGPVFLTLAPATIAPGEALVRVPAQHGDVHVERLGETTGRPFLRLRVRHAPIVCDAGQEGVFVGSEVTEGEIDARVPAARLGDTVCRLWHEVTHLGADERDSDAFVLDRSAGTVTFGSGARGGEPPVGRAIWASYRTGGGASGNVRAHTLTTLVAPLAGLTVTNPEAATGGRDTESLAAAIDRGSAEMHAGDRIVTARDYERAAVAAHGGVGRATVHASASLWAGGTPGEVSVLVVPSAGSDEALALTADEILARQVPAVLSEVGADLARRQPLGITSTVGWVGWKRFHVEATVIVHRAEDLEGVRERLAARLARTLSPFALDGNPGWGFGEPLRASTIYDVLLAEPGVRFVDDVRLVVDEVPGDVLALVSDPHQPGTSFCASDQRVFRTTDGARGWELVARFPGEEVERLATCAGRAGLLAAAARIGETGSRVHVSRDHGENWAAVAEFTFHVEDVVAAETLTGPVLFLATDRGLYRLALVPDGVPESVLLDAAEPDKACYALAVVSEPGSELQLAVAAQKLGGVFCSFQGGRAGTFQPLGLTGVDVRLLRVQRSPGRRFLHAGAFATGDDPGAGVQRLELQPFQPSPEGWRPVGATWVGGSCRDLAPVGDRVYAATARAGVSSANTANPEQPWRASAVDSGLPLQEVGRFRPIHAASTDGQRLLAGCGGGVWASTDGRTWAHASDNVFTDRVALPRTWLFAPGAHELTVVHDDARG